MAKTLVIAPSPNARHQGVRITGLLDRTIKSDPVPQQVLTG